MARPLRILVTRRDNIGDLVCTTPLLHALRHRYPDAYIALLASSYNVDVLRGNPDIDETFVFLKRQQKSHGYGLISLLWHRWKVERALRAKHFDYVILANGGWRYAQRIRAKHLIGFRERDNPPEKQPDILVPLSNAPGMHEVEKLAELGKALDVFNALSEMKLYPDVRILERLRQTLLERGFDSSRPLVGVHISSRRARQRWPVEKFAELLRSLYQQEPQRQFLLLWSPGKSDDPMHPGDDEKAMQLMSICEGVPILACPTTEVSELIAAMSCTSQVICSDGGALHVAAALGKPILCFFGDSIAAEWRPWGVPYVLLQPPSKIVADIDVEQALSGFNQLPTEV